MRRHIRTGIASPSIYTRVQSLEIFLYAAVHALGSSDRCGAAISFSSRTRTSSQSQYAALSSLPWLHLLGAAYPSQPLCLDVSAFRTSVACECHRIIWSLVAIDQLLSIIPRHDRGYHPDAFVRPHACCVRTNTPTRIRCRVRIPPLAAQPECQPRLSAASPTLYLPLFSLPSHQATPTNDQAVFRMQPSPCSLRRP